MNNKSTYIVFSQLEPIQFIQVIFDICIVTPLELNKYSFLHHLTLQHLNISVKICE